MRYCVCCRAIRSTSHGRCNSGREVDKELENSRAPGGGMKRRIQATEFWRGGREKLTSMVSAVR